MRLHVDLEDGRSDYSLQCLSNLRTSDREDLAKFPERMNKVVQLSAKQMHLARSAGNLVGLEEKVNVQLANLFPTCL